jgi:hypothetical protein
MKKNRAFVWIFLFLTLATGAKTVWAIGYDFVYPGASRAYITQGYSPKHQAYDYFYSNRTKVAAIQSGFVSGSRWVFTDNDAWYPDCERTINDRGNYLILDHGGGLESLYFHLSNTGNTPGAGANFSLGQYTALSDHTGCSSGPHLHFATKLYDTPFDPYQNPDWVGGKPIPMGYKDQNHNVHGPYALDRTKIRNKWLDLEGRLGSPLGNDYYETTPPPLRTPADILTSLQGVLVYTYYQKFERGYIYYTGTGAAQVIEYSPTSLPDIRAHRLAGTNGWNSTITVRNDGPTSADVSIVILNRDGTVKETRAYKDLRKNAAWTLNVRDVVYNPILGDWTQDFSGSALVYAARDVSVMVTQEYHDAGVYAAYSGVKDPSNQAYAPVLHKNNSGWNSQIFVQNAGAAAADVRIEFKPWAGYGNYHSITVPVGPLGSAVVSLNAISDGDLGTTFIGSAYISTDSAAKPIAVAWSQYKSNASLMEASNAGGIGIVAYAPLVQNYNSGWASGIAMQNASAVPHSMNLKYHRFTNGHVCHNKSRNIGAYHVYMYPSPPGNGNVSKVNCTTVLTARIIGNLYNAAANVNQLKLGSNYATDYAAIAAPSTKIGIPLVWKARNGWNSGLVIQNTTGYPTNFTVTYYNKSGDFVTSRTNTLHGLGEALIIYPIPTENNFEGSALVTSNLDVAVVINHLQAGNGGDRIMTHIGTHH